MVLNYDVWQYVFMSELSTRVYVYRLLHFDTNVKHTNRHFGLFDISGPTNVTCYSNHWNKQPNKQQKIN